MRLGMVPKSVSGSRCWKKKSGLFEPKCTHLYRFNGAQTKLSIPIPSKKKKSLKILKP